MRESEWIRRYIAPLVFAPGAAALKDDVATLNIEPGVTIVTTDMLVEGRHFLPTDPIDTVGRKLLRVSMSDIYGKGGCPSQALLSIAWPNGRPEDAFAALLDGLGQDLRAFQIELIGGDLVATDGPLVLSLTLTGTISSGRIPRRSGAMAGDSLWVSGEIGSGGIGLAAARRGEASLAAARYQLPQLVPPELAQQVGKTASASLDVSDGLLLDAQRLAEASGVRLEIMLERVPLAEPSKTLERVLEQCTAGDDYQILMTSRALEGVAGFTRIGVVTHGAGLALSWKGAHIDTPPRLGFEHG